MEQFSIKRLLSSRLFITIVIIAIEMVWVAMIFLRLIGQVQWLATAFEFLSIVAALYIITKDDVPAYRMGWIVIILVVPVFGGLMFLLLGEKRPARKMRTQLKRGTRDHSLSIRQEPEVMREFEEIAPRAQRTAQYIERYGRFPLWKNTKLIYHPIGEAHFEDMLTELKKAERFIFLEYFIIEEGEMWDSILDILCEKAAQGLDVRLIYDDMGCLKKLPTRYYKKLEEKGIKCLVFNPFIPVISFVMNNRNHRKMLIIDGCTAFTGGVNLADEYINRKKIFGHWKDTGVMLKGEAVWSFTVMFLEMWNSFRYSEEDFSPFLPCSSCDGAFQSDGFIQPFTDSPLDGETVSLNVYLEILSQAKDYVYIFTPYLAISDELQISLCSAAKRGVDVRMVLPGIPDKKMAFRLTRSYYVPLLEAGVKIYEYSPGFMHAKSYVCDDEMAVVGTINMDYRSLYLHFECAVFMYGCSAIKELKKDALKTFGLSHRVTVADRKKGFIRQVLGGLIDSVLRVFAPLF